MDIVIRYKHPPQGKKRREIVLREKVQKQKLIDPQGMKTGVLSAGRAVTEAEEVLADLESGEKLMGEIEIQLVVYSPFIARNLEELHEDEKALASDVLALDSQLRSIQGVTTYKEDVATLDYWLNNIPFLARVENTGRSIDCLSSWAAKLLPDENIQPREDFKKAKVLLVTERQELYGFDPFSERLVPNYNILIAGAPGTGKSVFARKLLSRFLYKQPFNARLVLDTPMKLAHLYSTLTVYELDMFSFIVRRGDGRSLPRDVPVFEGELSEYKTMSAEGVTGMRIFPSFSQRTGKNRILLMVKEKEACSDLQRRVSVAQQLICAASAQSASHASSACGRCAKEKQPSARFDMNIGEIQALRKLAQRALFNRDRLEVVLLEDATLSVKLSASRSGLEFDVVTPYVQKKLNFVNTKLCHPPGRP